MQFNPTASAVNEMLKSPKAVPTLPKLPVLSKPTATEPSANVLFQMEVAPYIAGKKRATGVGAAHVSRWNTDHQPSQHGTFEKEKGEKR